LERRLWVIYRVTQISRDQRFACGCGWGAMLLYAVRNYGVMGVGCTLSRLQYDYVQERIKEEGLIVSSHTCDRY